MNALSSRYSLQLVSVCVRERQTGREGMIERVLLGVCVCVCVTLSPCHPGHGEKSIDLQLELGRLPLSSDEQTLWPSRVCRQVLGMLCRPAVRQLCVLLHKVPFIFRTWLILCAFESSVLLLKPDSFLSFLFFFQKLATETIRQKFFFYLPHRRHY